MKQIRSKAGVISVFLTLTLFLSSCSNNINDAIDNYDHSSKEEMSISSLVSKSSQEYTGEELFKSVFFAYGDFAKHLPMYKGLIEKIEIAPAEQHRVFLSRFESFANKIKANNPEYFENFKKDISSGDNSNIQNAIKYGSISIFENVGILMPELQPLITEMERDEQLENLVNKDGEITQADLDALKVKYDNFLSDSFPVEPQACSWAVACAYYFAFGIHNTIGLTTNVAIAAAVAVYAAVKWWGPKLDSPSKPKAMDNSVEVLKLEMFVQEIADASTN